MRIVPDAAAAGRDQAAVTQIVQGALNRALTRLGLGSATVRPGWLHIDRSGQAADSIDIEVSYPGAIAATYATQRAARQELALAGREQLAAQATRQLAEVSEEGQASSRRALGCPCPGWQLDLAPPQWHLIESCDRALSQIPSSAAVRRLAEVIDWTEADEAVFCAAGCVLARVWPQMLAEMGAMVRQLCLIRGDELGAFTDFASHGAVFVNRRRLGPGQAGLPTGVRLAETLVHEATHHRCNAAAMFHPFLIDDADLPLANTPLRSDPRPLNGLFQQLVVLVRCQMFYTRLAEDDAGSHRQVLHGRWQRLASQASQALATVRQHDGALTQHGHQVVAEAEEILHQAAVTGSRQ